MEGSDVPTEPSPDGWSWFEAARLDALPSGTGHEFTHLGRVYALFRVGERVFALAGLCPHQQARLALGAVDPERSTVTCPRRGCLRWRFDPESGAHAGGLAVACPTFAVRVAGNAVFVRLPE